MKTYKHLYEKICDFENIYLAWRKARKGKRGREQAAYFERMQDDELLALQRELQTQTYQPGRYYNFFVHDSKKRLISAAPFRDRVVHHALYRVIEPIWETRFIHDTYANRIGKGTHRALDRTQEYARKYPFFLQCDVRQFFPSIDHAILRAEFARLIHDEKTLWLCDRILKSGEGVLAGEYEMDWFDGDDLFSVNRPRGLPIGNLTSQFWANVYLNQFDHFVKRDLKCMAYIRYVDDFLLFSSDVKTLLEWRRAIIQKMAFLRLTLHEESSQVNPTRAGIPFLGFRVFPEYRRVKRRKVVHFRRKLKALLLQYADGWLTLEKLDAAIKGWVNHVRYADSWGLRRAALGGIRL
ncbi:MAG: RNA-dependent DNA polymerase [Anaerolineae bacterium CFX3]|nr:RNA-dependent DNA polymerase [Anaerolineae bacterium CFX3]MCQ3945776.1 RNA-dependent DNA polymerase [Anaerolineae bacterium]RIK27252.1 MAG: RNA-dependent DNA polymerase [Anaerolineae bacterium]